MGVVFEAWPQFQNGYRPVQTTIVRSNSRALIQERAKTLNFNCPTPWCRVLLYKLTVAQREKFPEKPVAAFTRLQILLS